MLDIRGARIVCAGQGPLSASICTSIVWLGVGQFHGIVGGCGFSILTPLPTLLLGYPAVGAGSENLAALIPNWKPRVPGRISARGVGVIVLVVGGTFRPQGQVTRSTRWAIGVGEVVAVVMDNQAGLQMAM